MEDEIIAYLEKYGQPQTMEAIQTALQGGFDHYAPQMIYGFIDTSGNDVDPSEAVARRVAQLVTDGRIKEVREGVHSGGDQTVEYAPLNYVVQTA